MDEVARSSNAPFFVAGGTVPPGAPSYVERAADQELYEALLAGEFCYVLNSRQMGKSSLAVRTIAKLNDAGVRTAFVDLTRLGATGADPERWYAGLLSEAGRALGLRTEAMAYLRANPELPSAARLFSFLRDEALQRIDGPIVLLVDEIDAVRSLPFSADDLFAGLRELWNARAIDPETSRITVCLLGAALPGDLIRDPRRTPFNVGRRIELRDFTPDEAEPFGVVVGPARLRRALEWTGGHPFLTQTICVDLSNDSSLSVDSLVGRRYLDARARESDTNLADVANRLLGNGDPSVTDAERADTLSLYERMLRGKPVVDDEANPAAARIKMSGVARLDNGLLKLRNEVYRRSFDRRWVRANMPGQENRRQRKAFWKGALRAVAAASCVAAVILYFAVANARLARTNASLALTAEKQRDQARYDAYVASMRTLPLINQENNFSEINRILRSVEENPARGWEWKFWHRLANRARVDIPLGDYSSPTYTPTVSRDGRYVLLLAASLKRIGVFDLQAGRLARDIDLDIRKIDPASGVHFWLAEKIRRVLVQVGRRFSSYDLDSGKEIARASHPNLYIADDVKLESGTVTGGLAGRKASLDLETLKVTAGPL
ncbi:hypothetical protein EON82_18440, partial [bacterium]